MSTVYLYIPFKLEENPEELLSMAKNWQKSYQGKENMKAAISNDNYIPREIKIVIAGDDELEGVKSEEKIYVLSHGMPNTTDVANKPSNLSNKLTQEMVAKRMIEDGLPEKTKLTIKLYYCDESNNAEPRAMIFFETLQKFKSEKDYSSVDLHYYPGVILQAMHPPEDAPYIIDKAHKSAYTVSTIDTIPKDEINKIYREILDNSTENDLISHLENLDKRSLMSIILNLEPDLIKQIQEKAHIEDVRKFFQTLKDESNTKMQIIQNKGKPKNIRKQVSWSQLNPLAHTSSDNELATNNNSKSNVKSVKFTVKKPHGRN